LIVLDKGQIVGQGTAEELDQSQDATVRQFMRAATEATDGVQR
jgi:ABC-type transporter Mla maintaining outer membrane lipid asymmetry ATPase subunit MlaF